MSDVPTKNKPAVIAIVALTAAAAGYLGHDPLRAELMTARLYGHETSIPAPMPAPPASPMPPPAPIVLHQIEQTRIVYDGEVGAPVEKPKVAPRRKHGVP